MQIALTPIGFVRGGRTEATDDHWDREVCTIELDGTRFDATSLAALDSFSHVEVIYHFHLVDERDIVAGARQPRERADWPLVGIFAQRGKMRPNRLGVSVCALVAVQGITLTVRGLDAVDGTPVLDLKPFLTGFAPRGTVREPQWARDIMSTYW